MTTLVTGGTGYIGAHVVSQLIARGDDVVVVDDVITGDAARIGEVPLVRTDLASADARGVVERVIRDHGVDRVIHFAARKQVGESVERPVWYVQQNVGGLVHLLEAMEATGVEQLVFSSSAAVYGLSDDTGLISEDAPTRPINPYGESKLAGEWLIAAQARAGRLRATSLRYFNVAGCGEVRLADKLALNLVPMVIERLLRDDAPRVFGADYPTPDGTCIRDYVHVVDLAEAHLLALDHLATGESLSPVYNVGTGLGTSVLEIIDAVRTASGRDLTPVIEHRRPGDPPQLVADVRRIRRELGWEATRNVADMASSAWQAMAQRAGAVSRAQLQGHSECSSSRRCP
ncbi:UDP-glucose 4-epimerase GalE [Pseudoclavibacter endophyticus]|uniref:UDP-glucose 4-epimerase n=1 Tax=Pseudoclavibacter endophyticus TaxID=1778590 RepID=A0A6H9WE13_9MICO|nr:UDP-glucose 4-epimerase GalE [Pseudoclavibacter endophyticus]KAB1649119.1 UDP-glucose 4-epimerase GalE [Pseudoclavibacter endophyticus]GGA65263.1 UDP-glucose 4-epimerase GalE [Pseudoclavibacter endophyticus]